MRDRGQRRNPDMFYSAIQGPLSGNREAENERRMAGQKRDAQEKNLAYMASVIGLKHAQCTLLDCSSFNLFASGYIKRERKPVTTAIVSSLLELFDKDPSSQHDKAIIAACTRIHNDSHTQPDKGNFIDGFIREATLRLSNESGAPHAALSHEQKDRLTRFIKALGYLRSELTWHGETLFNLNPHPDRLS
jgi:hypothetical protein